MKKILIMSILGLGVFFSACTDPDKDPLQINNIKKGTLIALRGDAYDNLNNTDYMGAIDSFSRSRSTAAETFTFDADFIAEDINSLASVDVYANIEGQPRVKISTVQGSVFAVPTGGKYPRGSFSVTLGSILTAINKTASSLHVHSYITVSCDLNLKDGTKVLASSIVNSSLYETSFFYPAHKVLYLVGE